MGIGGLVKLEASMRLALQGEDLPEPAQDDRQFWLDLTEGRPARHAPPHKRMAPNRCGRCTAKGPCRAASTRAGRLYLCRPCQKKLTWPQMVHHPAWAPVHLFSKKARL